MTYTQGYTYFIHELYTGLYTINKIANCYILGSMKKYIAYSVRTAIQWLCQFGIFNPLQKNVANFKGDRYDTFSGDNW